MSMQNRSYSTVGIWLLPMLILSTVGPSGHNEAKKSTEFDVPWSWKQFERKDQHNGQDINTLFKQLDDLEQMEDRPGDPAKFLYPSSSQTYIHSESLPVGSETHNLKQKQKQDKNHELFDPLDLEILNAAGVGDSEQFNLPPSGTPKSKTGLIDTTTPPPTQTIAIIRSSTFCIPDSTPFRPVTTKCPAPTTLPTPTTPTTVPTPTTTTTSTTPPTPPTIRTTRKPSPPSIPTTKKVQFGPKGRKKSKHLSAKTAKIFLEIILSTKKQVLSVLKTLNYMEMEVLSQSPDDCPLPDFELGQSKLKKKPNKQKETAKPLKPSSSSYSQAFFFGIRPASQMESDSDIALAREEELKLKNRVWEEYQQQMRDIPHCKSRRFQMAPQAPIRLAAIWEPKRPQEQKNQIKYLRNKDTSDFGDT
ncbi:PH domain-containing protein DDB_G0287875 isoform X2 [Drosophila serrata]|uniref:PH domain-containing protein DDB_G0287875 isoform X2 n=1 Tax=Drosophila serrata TaxID=7274 RepID=UPI000A1D0478|nr:PH domain-containing protein DDB_G0287875 isoform X2 [Drosophila serrata]